VRSGRRAASEPSGRRALSAARARQRSAGGRAHLFIRREQQHLQRPLLRPSPGSSASQTLVRPCGRETPARGWRRAEGVGGEPPGACYAAGAQARDTRAPAPPCAACDCCRSPRAVHGSALRGCARAGAGQRSEPWTKSTRARGAECALRPARSGVGIGLPRVVVVQPKMVLRQRQPQLFQLGKLRQGARNLRPRPCVSEGQPTAHARALKSTDYQRGVPQARRAGATWKRALWSPSLAICRST